MNTHGVFRQFMSSNVHTALNTSSEPLRLVAITYINSAAPVCLNKNPGTAQSAVARRLSKHTNSHSVYIPSVTHVTTRNNNCKT